MSSKENAIRKVEQMLEKYGPLYALGDTPPVEMAPERMARLLRAMEKIAPFDQQIPDEVLEVAVLKTVTTVISSGPLKGLRIKATIFPKVAQEKLGEVAESLVHRGYLKSVSAGGLPRSSTPPSYEITEEGRRHLKKKMEDPEIVRILGQMTKSEA